MSSNRPEEDWELDDFSKGMQHWKRDYANSEREEVLAPLVMEAACLRKKAIQAAQNRLTNIEAKFNRKADGLEALIAYARE